MVHKKISVHTVRTSPVKILLSLPLYLLAHVDLFSLHYAMPHARQFHIYRRVLSVAGVASNSTSPHTPMRWSVQTSGLILFEKFGSCLLLLVSYFVKC